MKKTQHYSGNIVLLSIIDYVCGIEHHRQYCSFLISNKSDSTRLSSWSDSIIFVVHLKGNQEPGPRLTITPSWQEEYQDRVSSGGGYQYQDLSYLLNS